MELEFTVLLLARFVFKEPRAEELRGRSRIFFHSGVNLGFGGRGVKVLVNTNFAICAGRIGVATALLDRLFGSVGLFLRSKKGYRKKYREKKFH